MTLSYLKSVIIFLLDSKLYLPKLHMMVLNKLDSLAVELAISPGLDSQTFSKLMHLIQLSKVITQSSLNNVLE